LLTDGVLEARNANGDLFGFDRTAAISTRPAHEVARTAGLFGQEDDITVLTFTRHPIREDDASQFVGAPRQAGEEAAAS